MNLLTLRMIQAIAVVALCCHQTSAATLKALQKELEAEQESRLVPEVFVVSELVGEKIDASERERYGLFPSVKEFVSATHYKRPDGLFYVEFVTRGSSGKKETATNDVVPAGISYVGSRIENAQSNTD